MDFQAALFDSVPETLLDTFKECCLKNLNQYLNKYGKKYGFSEIRVTLKMNWELKFYDEKGDRILNLGCESDPKLTKWLDDNAVVLEAYRHKNPEVDYLWVRSERDDGFFSLFSVTPSEKIPDELEKLTALTNEIRKKVEKTPNNFIIIDGLYKGLVGKAVLDSEGTVSLRIYGKKGKLLPYRFTVKKEHTKPINK